jgi:xeroderma pigmentosum group C-complementing protein
MVPRGAVHIPLRGTARICRKLNIEHAEACTGFEFGKQRAVPILTGVVVAVENEDMVIDAWEIDEAEKAKKEADKREKLVLSLWKKFLSGLRIVERMKAEYGEDVELPAKTVKPIPKPEPSGENPEWEVFQNHTDFEGGFLRGDEPADGRFVREESAQQQHDEDMAGGFFAASQEDPVHGDLVIDHGDKKAEQRTAIAESSYQTPISLISALQKPGNEDADVSDGDEPMDIDDLQENSEDDEPHKPSSTRRQSSSSRPARGRPRGRAAKPTPSTSTSTRERKSILIDSSDEEDKNNSSLSDARTPPPSTRSAPKRKAARKSDAMVKSHFFAEGSEGETDLTDMTDRTSPKKRGKTSGRGRGRGRGKAKG